MKIDNVLQTSIKTPLTWECTGDGKKLEIEFNCGVLIVKEKDTLLQKIILSKRIAPVWEGAVTWSQIVPYLSD